MSGTTSTVSILHKDKTIKTISTNYDGYPLHTGIFLLKNYLSLSDVKKLIKQGNISSFGSPNNSSKDPAKTFLTRKDFYDNCEHYNFNYLFKEDDSTWYLVKNKRLFNLCNAIDKTST